MRVAIHSLESIFRSNCCLSRRETVATVLQARPIDHQSATQSPANHYYTKRPKTNCADRQWSRWPVEVCSRRRDLESCLARNPRANDHETAPRSFASTPPDILVSVE